MIITGYKGSDIWLYKAKETRQPNSRKLAVLISKYFFQNI